MKSAILACSSNDPISSRLTQLLQSNNIDYIQLFVNDSVQNAAATLSSSNQLNVDENDLVNLSNILSDKIKTENSDLVVYDFLLPPSNCAAVNSDQEIQIDPLKTYGLQIELLNQASKIGSTKFIRCSCISESHLENHLQNDWNNTKFNQYDTMETVYRLASRDMSLLISYLDKIDYIHTRCATVLDTNSDSKNSQSIVSALSALYENRKLNSLDNDLPIDIISAECAAKSYFHLGKTGKNKKNYYIGSGQFLILSSMFSTSTESATTDSLISTMRDNSSPSLAQDIFSTQALLDAVSFVPAPLKTSEI
jgi:hypothetical protein